MARRSGVFLMSLNTSLRFSSRIMRQLWTALAVRFSPGTYVAPTGKDMPEWTPTVHPRYPPLTRRMIIMVAHAIPGFAETGKPLERVGRKATGLELGEGHGSRVAGECRTSCMLRISLDMNDPRWNGRVSNRECPGRHDCLRRARIRSRGCRCTSLFRAAPRRQIAP